MNGYKESDFWIDSDDIERFASLYFWEIQSNAEQILKEAPLAVDQEFMNEVRSAARGNLLSREYTNWVYIKEVMRRWPMIQIDDLKFSGFCREITVGDDGRVPYAGEQY